MTSFESKAQERANGASDDKTAPRRLIVFLPLVVFVTLALAFAWWLIRNPGDLPSTLVGSPVPEFALPPVQGRELGLSSDDLVGEVSLINVWASWCPPCRREKPLFLQLKAAGIVPIHGLNNKNDPEHAARFLNTYGDAYTRTGADLNGRVGIEWGVYGLPETFVIDHGGVIRHRHVGEMTAQALEETMLPLVLKLQEE
jgi:cytochrome c biogenesis protein CcmG, thiol:disulfide interchange protein DsbE